MTYVAAADRYERIPYRRSGRKLPEVSLGLWQNFGDDRPLDAQREVIRRAFDLGVTHFDLANNYGPRTSEIPKDAEHARPIPSSSNARARTRGTAAAARAVGQPAWAAPTLPAIAAARTPVRPRLAVE